MLTVESLNPTAQHIAQLVLNSLVPGIFLSLLVWLVLKGLKLNATTNYIVWFITLIAVSLTPLSTNLITLPEALTTPFQTVNLLTSSTANIEAGEPPTKLVLEAIPSVQSSHTSSVSTPETVSEVATPATLPQTIVQQLQGLKVPTLSITLIWFIVGAYLMGVILLLTQLFRSHITLSQLKRRSILMQHPQVVPKGRRGFALKHSKDITVPLAAGLAKPCILLPSQLEEKLSRSAFEHVILHEYAHLVRFDDWTKLIQRIIQTLFFFHPAIHFISRQLNLEREIACDDWVISQQGQKRQSYAKSLVTLVELALTSKRMKQPHIEGSAIMIKTQIEKRILMLMDAKRPINITLPLAKFVSSLALLTLSVLLISQMAPLFAQSSSDTLKATLTDAELVAFNFLEARDNWDVDALLLTLAENVELSDIANSPDDFIDVPSYYTDVLKYYAAANWNFTPTSCTQRTPGTGSTPVSCQVLTENAWTRALGVGPFELSFSFGVENDNNKISSVYGVWNRNENIVQVFRTYLSENHPEDFELIYASGQQVLPRSEEALEALKLRTEEFVQAVSGN